MRSIALRLAGLVGAAALFAAVAWIGGGPVSTAEAVHAHFLVTPGTCVENIGRGQTSKAASEPGGHKFHDKVHIGQAGSPGGPLHRDGQAPVIVERWGPSGEVGDLHAQGTPQRANQEDCLALLD